MKSAWVRRPSLRDWERNSKGELGNHRSRDVETHRPPSEPGLRPAPRPQRRQVFPKRLQCESGSWKCGDSPGTRPASAPSRRGDKEKNCRCPKPAAPGRLRRRSLAEEAGIAKWDGRLREDRPWAAQQLNGEGKGPSAFRKPAAIRGT